MERLREWLKRQMDVRVEFVEDELLPVIAVVAGLIFVVGWWP